jgi:cell division protein FtsL
MNKKIVALSFLIIAILFVSAIAGTILYYNGVVNDKNSHIASLNNQMGNLNSQISNLSVVQVLL